MALSAGDLSAPPIDWQHLALHHLAPGLGAIIATLMFFSPLKAIQQAVKAKSLGELNPLPLIAIVANCTVWLVYGAHARDIYVILANEPGFLIGLYMTITAYGYADDKARTLMTRAFLFFAFLISGVSVSIALFVTQPALQLSIAGYQAVGVLLIYYSSPLSVLAHVIRSKSSASIYWPLSAMSLLNSSLWVAYGMLAVNDPFIWAPNAAGAVLGVVQLLLVCLYPIPADARVAVADGAEEPLLAGAA